jgi:hypothetical protein
MIPLLIAEEDQASLPVLCIWHKLLGYSIPPSISPYRWHNRTTVQHHADMTNFLIVSSYYMLLNTSFIQSQSYGVHR